MARPLPSSRRTSWISLTASRFMRNSTASPRTSRTAAPSTSCPRPFRHISRSSSASSSARSPCSASARHAIRSWKSASKLSRNYSFTQIKGLPVAVPFHIHSSNAKALHYFSQRRGNRPAPNGRALAALQITQDKFRAAMRPTITPTSGTEPPRPTFRCTSSMCQRKRKIRGVKRGKETIRCPCPFCLRR